MPDIDGATADTDVNDGEATEAPEDVESGSDQELFDELSKVFEDTDSDAEVSDQDESDSGDDSDSSDETFTITVDGEEVEVTLDELRDGYSRQADYTKKTQALASERKRLEGLEQLAQALDTNPQVALEELAKALGVEMGAKAPSSDIQEDADLEGLDPVEIQVRELQKQIEGLTGKLSERDQRDSQAQEDAALQAELDQIRRDNDDPNLDDEALLRFAIDNKINDLSNAYKFMKLDAGNKAPSQSDAALEAKRKLPPIEDGASRRNSRKGEGPIGSITDAFKAAFGESQSD